MSSQKHAVEGVETYPLRIIEGHEGAVLHMLQADHPAFDTYGETYFSEIISGVTKGWKLHREMTQRIAVPVGEVVFYIKDGRKASPTEGNHVSIQLGRPRNYQLLIIPPGLWYSFRNPGSLTALVVNVANLPHKPSEVERKALTDPEFADVNIY